MMKRILNKVNDLNEAWNWTATTIVGAVLVMVCLPFCCKYNDPAPYAESSTQIENLVIPASKEQLMSALNSVWTFQSPGYNSIGTCMLIGRFKQPDNTYAYRGLTAYHVVEDWLDKDDMPTLELKMTNAGWQQEPSKLEVTASKDWALPKFDWATFVFFSSEKLPCAEIGDVETFKAIMPDTDVFLVGNDGGFGIGIRKCNVSHTHSILPWESVDDRPWSKFPAFFFRLFVVLRPGASGGAVINQDGKLIGMVNAYYPIAQTADVGVTAIVHKLYILRDFVLNTDPTFLNIED